MKNPVAVMIGHRGLAEGEFHLLGPRCDLALGRSRVCEISFQRFRAFLALSEEERRLRDHYNHAVSRRHLRIVVEGTLLRLEDLSSVGSQANGEKLTGVREFDLAKGPVTVRLGQAEEGFEFTLVEADEAQARVAKLGPPAEVHRIPGVPGMADDPTPQAQPALPTEPDTLGLFP
jgi:hypothetical protein